MFILKQRNLKRERKPAHSEREREGTREGVREREREKASVECEEAQPEMTTRSREAGTLGEIEQSLRGEFGYSLPMFKLQCTTVERWNIA